MRNRHVTEQFGQILERLNQLDTIRHDVGRLDAAIITRYPDSQRAAESYEALRKAVMAAGGGAGRHIADLVALSSLIDEGATVEAIQLRIRDLLGVMGLRPLTIEDCVQNGSDLVDAAFEVVGDSAHPRPAWIQETDRGAEVYRRGYINAPPARPAAGGDATQAREERLGDPSLSASEQVPDVPAPEAQETPSVSTRTTETSEVSTDSAKDI